MLYLQVQVSASLGHEKVNSSDHVEKNIETSYDSHTEFLRRFTQVRAVVAVSRIFVDNETCGHMVRV